MDHFIFGYGSLLSEESRAKTGISGVSFQAVLKGFERSWNVRVKEQKMTALGITKKKGATCNGVLFAVPKKELVKFDRREEQYDRLRISPEKVVFLEETVPAHASFWVYVARNPQNPTKDYPIVQSYVDVALDGCLALSETCAKHFLSTTQGWGYPWVDDRAHPRYIRAMQNPPIAAIQELFKDASLKSKPI